MYYAFHCIRAELMDGNIRRRIARLEMAAPPEHTRVTTIERLLVERRDDGRLWCKSSFLWHVGGAEREVLDQPWSPCDDK